MKKEVLLEFVKNIQAAGSKCMEENEIDEGFDGGFIFVMDYMYNHYINSIRKIVNLGIDLDHLKIEQLKLATDGMRENIRNEKMKLEADVTNEFINGELYALGFIDGMINRLDEKNDKAIE